MGWGNGGWGGSGGMVGGVVGRRGDGWVVIMVWLVIDGWWVDGGWMVGMVGGWWVIVTARGCRVLPGTARLCGSCFGLDD